MHEKSRSDRQARRSDRKKSKKKKKSRYRSRSRERSSYRRSHTSPSRSHHSRSSSQSSQYSRSPSRSPRRRRTSRSPRRSRYSSSDRSSRSTSRDRKSSSKRSLEKPQILTPEEQLKQKMQKALKAAADADAQLRGIGALEPKNEPESELPASLSISSQISRANAIEEISSTEFRPRNFVSSRGAPKHEEESSGHETAIFGKAIVSTDIGSTLNTNVLILDENNLADEKLFLNVDKKKERWLKKLAEMRKSILSSN